MLRISPRALGQAPAATPAPTPSYKGLIAVGALAVVSYAFLRAPEAPAGKRRRTSPQAKMERILARY